MSHEFATLLPHFNMLDPMHNKKVKEVMHLMFGTILRRWAVLPTRPDPTGLLLHILPSVIWHSEWLLKVAREIPGHPFNDIPLLQNRQLLMDLKAMVTTNLLDL